MRCRHFKDPLFHKMSKAIEEALLSDSEFVEWMKQASDEDFENFLERAKNKARNHRR